MTETSEHSTIYGLDFGTSHSSLLVACGTRLTAVRDPLISGPRASRVPSALFIGADGHDSIGDEAYRRRGEAPDRYLRELKRSIGEHPVRVRGESFEVHALVARILSPLRRQAEDAAPAPDVLVCTVPVAWELRRRELMLDALQIAGFDRERTHIVSEPEAAAAHAVSKLGPAERARNLLVYDFGGGTFDCAVVRVGPDASQVLTAAGHPTLGGADLDDIVMELIRERFPESVAELDRPTLPVDVLKRKQDLERYCERLKIEFLGTRDRAVFSDKLTAFDPAVDFLLERDELEIPVREKIEETLSICEGAVKACDLRWRDLDLIVPVGGSSSIPAVGEALAQRGDAVVLRLDAPDLAVVRGAVEWGRRITPRTSDETRRGLRLQAHAVNFEGIRPVNAIAFDPSSQCLAAACGDHVVRVWNIEAAGAFARLLHHGHWVTDVAFNHDGSRLMSSGRDGTAKIWNDRDQPSHVVGRMPGRDVAHKAGFGPEGKWIALHRGQHVETLRIDDPSSRHMVDADLLGGMALSHQGCLAVALNGQACLYDVRSGAKLATVSADSIYPWTELGDLALSHDGLMVAGAYRSTGKVWTWSTDDGSRLLIVDHNQTARSDYGISIAFSHDDRWLASAGGRILRVWDLQSGREVFPFISLDAPANDVTFSSDGSYLAVATGNAWHLWEIQGR